jgi:hypothetical protein
MSSRLMTRTMRRASEANGRRLQRKEWNAFEDVTEESKARHLALNPGSKFSPDRVWANNKYVVQAFEKRGFLGFECTKLMIRRCDAEPIYSWPDLQRIKNELFGPEETAIQAFPAESELVDDANLYWLWVLKREPAQLHNANTMNSDTEASHDAK